MTKATTTGEQLVSAAKVSDHKPVHQSASAKPNQEQRSVTTQRPAPHATAPMVPSEHVVLNFTF